MKTKELTKASAASVGFFVASLVLIADSAKGDPLAVLRQGRAIYAPEMAVPIDWSAVPRQGAFVKTILPYVPAEVGTEVQVAHDSQSLYVRAVMRVSNRDALVGRERFDLWDNEAFEIFVQTPELKERRAHWHLAADFLGQKYLAEESESTEMPGTYNWKVLDARSFDAAPQVTADGWEVVFRIPAKGFGGSWKANFCRSHKLPHAFSSWSLTKSFHDQKRFGLIVFDRERDNGAAYAQALSGFQGARTAIYASYKRKSYDWKWAFGALEGYRPLGVRYSAERGYGWVGDFEVGKTSADLVSKRRTPLNTLADNFIGGADANVFRLDLPDGAYKVHLVSGVYGADGSPHRREFAVEANGRPVIDFSCGDMSLCFYDFPVEVKGGRLEIRFIPADVKDNPVTAAYRPASLDLVKGFCVNSVVAFPKADRKLAARQLAADELELKVHSVEELANLDFVEHDEPTPSAGYSDAARTRGWAAFVRPLGENIYAGSKPGNGEEVQSLRVRAAPGEKFHISFGVLPLRDVDGEAWTIRGDVALRVREAQQMPWGVGDGRYSFVPYQLEEAAFVDHDLDVGVTRNLWLTGTVPEDATPGMLKSVLSIGSAELPVEVEVLPFRLDDFDFAWGGYHPDGYWRPLCYEDRVAAACADLGMNGFVFYANPERLRPGSFNLFKERVRIYQSAGIKGRYVVYCSLDGVVEQRLIDRQIDALPKPEVDDQIALARRISSLRSLPGNPVFYYSAMDEAHCKGDPYWSEQIRLFRDVKESVPGILTAGSESERSYLRSLAYVDLPILFDISDFRKITDVQRMWCYPNQAMLEGENANAGRYCTGLLPSVTAVRGVLPWMVMCGRDNSPLRAGNLEMITASGVGGYHVIPRTVTVMGEVGLYDARYFATLRRLAAEVEAGTPAQQEAARRARLLLEMVEEGTKGSYMYYYYNGHLPAKTFLKLRDRLTDAILELISAREAAR